MPKTPEEKDEEEDRSSADDASAADSDEDSEEEERPAKRSKPNNTKNTNSKAKKGGSDEDDSNDGSSDDEEEEDEDYKEPIRKIAPKDPPKSQPDDDDDKPMPKSEGTTDWYLPLSGVGEHKRAVSSVKFAPSRLLKKDQPSAIAASSSADGYIKLWNVQDSVNNKTDGQFFLEPTLSCGGHTRGINDIAWNPVAPYLASASDDKTIRLWDMVTGDPLVEYRGHDSFVFCVDQYRHMIASGSFDETVKLWDIRSGDCVSTLPAHSDPVTSVSFNRDGTVVCTGSHDGLIRLWDVATGECLKTIYAAGNPPVCSAKFSPNSKYILAGTLMDATLRLWPVARTGSNLCAKTYKSEHHVNKKYSIVADFMHDGNIVTGSETGKIVIYDLQSQNVKQVLGTHEDAVLAVSAHDKLPLLASGAMTNDRRVSFWAPKNLEL